MKGGPGPAGFALAFALLCALALASVTIGRYPVSPGDAVAVLVSRLGGPSHGLPDAVETVVLRVRLPRLVAGILVGAALAAAGATYQGLFRNPLVSPDVLGVSSGAGLGAALGIFLSLPVVAVQGLAFACGLGAVLLAMSVAGAARGARDPVLALVLAGVVIGTLCGAGISLVKYLADPYDQLPAIEFWLLGSLASVRPRDLAALLPPVLVGLAPLVLLRWRINVLSLGDEEARALGIEPARLRAVAIAASTLVTASAVATAGVVGWVGLVVPHAARMLVGPGFGRLLPTAALLGAAYVLAVDDLARTLARIEVPLGVLNAVVGAPCFLALLARVRTGWS